MDMKTAQAMMGLLNLAKCEKRGDWLMARCPFATWRHEGGRDIAPSFGISLRDGKHTVYHCFGCMDRARPIEHLPHELWINTGQYPRALAALIMAKDAPPDRRRKRFTRDDCSSPWDGFRMAVPQVFPMEFLDCFPLLEESNEPATGQVLDYLATRGITADVAFAYQLRIWSRRTMPTICFPFTNEAGTLQVLRARTLPKRLFTISKKALGIEADLPTLKTSGAWFGLHLVDPYKPVLVVEGELDCMRLASLGLHLQHGFGVVAVGTSHVADEQYRRLNNREVILGLDSDTPGRRAGLKTRNRLLKRGHVITVLDWGLANCKDPGDLPDVDAFNKVYAQRHRFLP